MLNLLVPISLLLSPMGDETAIELPPLQEVGRATYYFGPFKLYKATLLSADGLYKKSSKFELKLEYKRSISAQKLANASLVEMARMKSRSVQDFENLRSPLEKCFGNVSKGDVIIGKKLTADITDFYVNGELSCNIETPEFSDNFFAIWLGSDARYPKKGLRLKGLRK